MGILIAKAIRKAIRAKFLRAGQSQISRRQVPRDLDKVKGCPAVGKEQIEDGQEHEQGSGHRVENELDRRVDLPLTPPDPDQEIHGNQHDFPKHIKQHEIESAENTDHARFKRQKTNHVRLHPVGD
jgi:hypothetical protein